MEEISMHSVNKFEALVNYLEETKPSLNISLSKFVPHTMWEQLEIDS
jgi:hypothetical protein